LLNLTEGVSSLTTIDNCIKTRKLQHEIYRIDYYVTPQKV